MGVVCNKQKRVSKQEPRRGHGGRKGEEQTETQSHRDNRERTGGLLQRKGMAYSERKYAW